jgi:hypothetical protein
MSSAIAPTATPHRSRELRRDLKTLALFISIYCRYRHDGAVKNRAEMKVYDIEEIAGRPLFLCEDCHKLLIHAFVKRSHCPMDPKPMCKHCPNHCYHPAYRAQIREVMQYVGKRMLLSGRLDYLFHLLF